MKLEEYVYQGRSFEVASDIFRGIKRRYLLMVLFGSYSGTQLPVLMPTLMNYYIHFIINVIVFIIIIIIIIII